MRVTTITRCVMTTHGPDVRRDFRRAAESFAAVVRGIQPDSWERPALGVWNLRDLTGHTSRALLTIESYLDPARTADRPKIQDAAGYFRAAAGALADPAAVAERGRQAGAALGDKPVVAISSIVERVLQLIDNSHDDALVSTPVGTITLISYLPTRTFELVVHGLDLVAATGAAAPADLPLAPCLLLAADLAIGTGHADQVLLALTGRRPLADGFSVL